MSKTEVVDITGKVVLFDRLYALAFATNSVISFSVMEYLNKCATARSMFSDIQNCVPLSLSTTTFGHFIIYDVKSGAKVGEGDTKNATTTFVANGVIKGVIPQCMGYRLMWQNDNVCLVVCEQAGSNPLWPDSPKAETFLSNYVKTIYRLMGRQNYIGLKDDRIDITYKQATSLKESYPSLFVD